MSHFIAMQAHQYRNTVMVINLMLKEGRLSCKVKINVFVRSVISESKILFDVIC